MARRQDRNILMAFYVTQEEKDQIYKNAENADLTFSSYARKVLLGKMANDYGVTVIGEVCETNGEVTQNG